MAGSIVARRAVASQDPADRSNGPGPGRRRPGSGEHALLTLWLRHIIRAMSGRPRGAGPRRPPRYAELRAASAFSFLRGASLPEDLIDRAAELGLPAVALADRNGVYGAPRATGAAKEAGIRALVGAEVVLDEGPGSKRPSSDAAGAGGQDRLKRPSSGRHRGRPLQASVPSSSPLAATIPSRQASLPRPLFLRPAREGTTSSRQPEPPSSILLPPSAGGGGPSRQPEPPSPILLHPQRGRGAFGLAHDGRGRG
ncbi:MAG TPA: PHP domain-containing protein, partial [Thermoanaerobaculia bacterium]|nr:PHP domain-containing protein [Thermoanaerobaculia bacterium]